MKNKLLVASLLAVMSAATFAQTAPTATAKPGSTPAVTVKPGSAPVGPVGRMPDPEQMAKAQVARFDTNKDGKVSLEEFLVPANASFKRTDLNHDGFVTAAELAEFGKRQMAEFSKLQAKPAQLAAPGAPANPTKPVAPAEPVKPAK